MDSDGCINHCNETKRKGPKKIGDILSHVTIGTNVTKGVLMIRPHLCVQHYVTRVTMVSGRCINWCNETKRKSRKNWGHLFPRNDRNKCNKASFNDYTGMSVSITM